MKLIQLAVFASIFLCAQANAEIQNGPDRAFVPPQPRERRMNQGHGAHTANAISEQDVNEAVDKLQQEPYSTKKISALRQLMMRSRRTVVSEQTQEKVNTLLQEAHKKHNKENRRESLILRGLLSMAQISPLLSDNHKESIKKLTAEISEDPGILNHEQASSSINDLFKIKAHDNYSAKASSLSQIMRRMRFLKADKNAQSEVSAAIHDLYDERSLSDIGSLAKLQSILQQAQTTPLLSTIKQYEVKEIMLPEVTKNLTRAQALAAATAPRTENTVKEVKLS